MNKSISLSCVLGSYVLGILTFLNPVLGYSKEEIQRERLHTKKKAAAQSPADSNSVDGGDELDRNELPASPIQPPIVASVVGEAGIMVGRTDRPDWKSAYEGTQLSFGDNFRTSNVIHVRLAFPDEIFAVVSPDAFVGVSSEKHGRLMVPVLNVFQGEVRILLEARASAEAKKKLRFIVTTNQARVQVKGTDFMVKADPFKQETEIHTLTGIVEVGGWKDSRLNSPYQKLAPGFWIKYGPQSVESLPARKFDLKDFLEDYYDSNPQAESLWRLAVRDAKSDVYAKKFRKLEQKSARKSAGMTIPKKKKSDGKSFSTPAAPGADKENTQQKIPRSRRNAGSRFRHR